MSLFDFNESKEVKAMIDKYVFVILPGEISFHRNRIKGGKIVQGPPIFTLRKSDFVGYHSELRKIVAEISRWLI